MAKVMQQVVSQLKQNPKYHVSQEEFDAIFQMVEVDNYNSRMELGQILGIISINQPLEQRFVKFLILQASVKDNSNCYYSKRYAWWKVGQDSLNQIRANALEALSNLLCHEDHDIHSEDKEKILKLMNDNLCDSAYVLREAVINGLLKLSSVKGGILLNVHHPIEVNPNASLEDVSLDNEDGDFPQNLVAFFQSMGPFDGCMLLSDMLSLLTNQVPSQEINSQERVHHSITRDNFFVDQDQSLITSVATMISSTLPLSSLPFYNFGGNNNSGESLKQKCFRVVKNLILEQQLNDMQHNYLISILESNLNDEHVSKICYETLVTISARGKYHYHEDSFCVIEGAFNNTDNLAAKIAYCKILENILFHNQDLKDLDKTVIIGFFIHKLHYCDHVTSIALEVLGNFADKKFLPEDLLDRIVFSMPTINQQNFNIIKDYLVLFGKIMQSYSESDLSQNVVFKVSNTLGAILKNELLASDGFKILKQLQPKYNLNPQYINALVDMTNIDYGLELRQLAFRLLSQVLIYDVTHAAVDESVAFWNNHRGAVIEAIDKGIVEPDLQIFLINLIESIIPQVRISPSILKKILDTEFSARLANQQKHDLIFDAVVQIMVQYAARDIDFKAFELEYWGFVYNHDLLERSVCQAVADLISRVMQQGSQKYSYNKILAVAINNLAKVVSLPSGMVEILSNLFLNDGYGAEQKNILLNTLHLSAQQLNMWDARVIDKIRQAKSQEVAKQSDHDFKILSAYIILSDENTLKDFAIDDEYPKVTVNIGLYRASLEFINYFYRTVAKDMRCFEQMMDLSQNVELKNALYALRKVASISAQDKMSKSLLEAMRDLMVSQDFNIKSLNIKYILRFEHELNSIKQQIYNVTKTLFTKMSGSRQCNEVELDWNLLAAALEASESYDLYERIIDWTLFGLWRQSELMQDTKFRSVQYAQMLLFKVESCDKSNANQKTKEYLYNLRALVISKICDLNALFKQNLMADKLNVNHDFAFENEGLDGNFRTKVFQAYKKEFTAENLNLIDNLYSLVSKYAKDDLPLIQVDQSLKLTQVQNVLNAKKVQEISSCMYLYTLYGFYSVMNNFINILTGVLGGFMEECLQDIEFNHSRNTGVSYYCAQKFPVEKLNERIDSFIAENENFIRGRYVAVKSIAEAADLKCFQYVLQNIEEYVGNFERDVLSGYIAQILDRYKSLISDEHAEQPMQNGNFTISLEGAEFDVSGVFMALAKYLFNIAGVFEARDCISHLHDRLEASNRVFSNIFEHVKFSQYQTILFKSLSILTPYKDGAEESSVSMRLVHDGIMDRIMKNIIHEQANKLYSSFRSWAFPVGDQFGGASFVVNADNYSQLADKISDATARGYNALTPVDDLIVTGSFDYASKFYPSFITWTYAQFPNQITNLLSGLEVLFKSDINKSQVKGYALRLHNLNFKILSSDSGLNQELQSELSTFKVRLTHPGFSQFKFKDQVYEKNHKKLTIEFSFEMNPQTQVPRFVNEAYKQISKYDQAISPFTDFIVQICANDGSAVSSKLMDLAQKNLSSLRLELFGDASYLDVEKVGMIEIEDTYKEYV